MNVWHVYIDEDYKKELALYSGFHNLPFADEFSKMKLFRHKEKAMLFMHNELNKIKKLFGLRKIQDLYNEAVDGGEFVIGFAAYVANSSVVYKAIRFKAVKRIVVE